ncbi:MAG: redox-sensing transcriptional repressor Rex [Deltaproteobacteria bacterium]|nr:redox-sensing transcriptional repressor Rex [Deltaproteobacteria bacterium]
MNKKGKIKTKKISELTIRRLSIYYRTLNVLEKLYRDTLSSKELSEIEGINSAQIRKDLSLFGSFGVRGIGYDIQSLKKALSDILGLNRKWNVVLIGAWQFSEVLVNSEALKENNFIITKIFNETSDKININDSIMVYDIDQLEKRIDPKKDHIAIIALPPQKVQNIIYRLEKIGIEGVLYFASRAVKTQGNMVVINQDISINLGMLTYKIMEKKQAN